MTPTKTPRERFLETLRRCDYNWYALVESEEEELLSVVENLLEEARQEAREEMITYISKHQWWEETEDNYRERFWFAPKYSSF